MLFPNQYSYTVNMHHGIAGITSCELGTLLTNTLCRNQMSIKFIFMTQDRLYV